MSGSSPAASRTPSCAGSIVNAAGPHDVRLMTFRQQLPLSTGPPSPARHSAGTRPAQPAEQPAPGAGGLADAELDPLRPRGVADDAQIRARHEVRRQLRASAVVEIVDARIELVLVDEQAADLLGGAAARVHGFP